MAAFEIGAFLSAVKPKAVVLYFFAWRAVETNLQLLLRAAT
jgi:hypothetical protein